MNLPLASFAKIANVEIFFNILLSIFNNDEQNVPLNSYIIGDANNYGQHILSVFMWAIFYIFILVSTVLIYFKRKKSNLEIILLLSTIFGLY